MQFGLLLPGSCYQVRWRRRRRHCRSCGSRRRRNRPPRMCPPSAGVRCDACRSIGRMGARRLPALQPRPQRRARLYRALRAGVPAERHGDHPAHELLLAARLGFSRSIFLSRVSLTGVRPRPTLRRLACARIAANGGRHPFMFVARSFRTHSSRGPRIACSVAASNSAQTWTPRPKEIIHAVHENDGARRRGAVACARSAGRARQCAVAQQSRRRRGGSGRHQSRRRRKCIGGITAITVGIAGTIIIATTIIVTGAAGNCDSLAQISHRPASLRACFRFGCALKLARLLPVISDGLDQREEFRHEELDRGSLCRRRARGCRAGCDQIAAAAAPQAKAQSAGTSDATDFSAHRYVRRHYRHYGYYRPYYGPYLLRSAGLLSAISLLRAGAVHLRYRVWSGLVVSVLWPCRVD